MPDEVTIYHGSQTAIERPVFGEGNPRNDYGLGFYCTQELELAKEWACTEEDSGYANQYVLALSGLSVMRLSGADYHILNWLAVLLANRTFRIANNVAAEGKAYLLDTFLPDTQSCDIIMGYRANDSYFSFANAFLNNTLSLAQLERAMALGKLGEQTVLKSRKAFGQIRFVRSEVADREIYYPMKNARDKEARSSYRKERESSRAADSIYLVDILRGGWGNDDARIRRNISG
ncbi:MAG: DUF3990 domain-containing protein [Oscillospiraceae bacterium]|jgi:hypothetical protein|nr:DUF3990 domain-containing protein [Oscillospiraceae bacterium]